MAATQQGAIAKAPPDSMPEWLPQIEKQLREFLTLPPNWNSYGSRPIHPDAVRAAMDLLSRIAQANTPLPTAVPTVKGGVQLEWHLGGADLEVELAADTPVQVFFEDANETIEWEADAIDAVPRLALLITRLSSQS